MGFLSDVTGGLSDVLAPVLSFMGTQSQNDQSAANQASANQFSAQQFATRYQTTVKDLEGAGLNPMLAYGATPNAPSSATPAPVQNALGNAVSSYQTSRATSAQTALQNEQLKQTASQTELNSATAAKQKADTIVSMKDAQLKDEQISNEKARNPNIAASTTAYQGQATASAASAAQSYKMIESLNAQIDKLRQEAQVIKQTGDRSLPESDFAKKYPTTYLILDKFLPSLSGAVRSLK